MRSDESDYSLGFCDSRELIINTTVFSFINKEYIKNVTKKQRSLKNIFMCLFNVRPQ